MRGVIWLGVLNGIDRYLSIAGCHCGKVFLWLCGSFLFLGYFKSLCCEVCLSRFTGCGRGCWIFNFFPNPSLRRRTSLYDPMMGEMLDWIERRGLGKPGTGGHDLENWVYIFFRPLSTNTMAFFSWVSCSRGKDFPFFYSFFGSIEIADVLCLGQVANCILSPLDVVLHFVMAWGWIPNINTHLVEFTFFVIR